jgi:hypothetical protein
MTAANADNIDDLLTAAAAHQPAHTPEVVSYSIRLFPHGDPWCDIFGDIGTYTITVERRDTDKWAVCWRGNCWNGHDWAYEPLPSGRTDTWKAQHRFTLDTALAHAVEQAAVLRDTQITQLHFVERARDMYST